MRPIASPIKQSRPASSLPGPGRPVSPPLQPITGPSRQNNFTPSISSFAKSKFLVIALALFVLLAGLSFADSGLFGVILPDAFIMLFNSPPIGQGTFLPPDQSWFPLSLVALLFSFMLSAFGYLLSGALGPRLLAWSKQNVYATAKSALIVIFIFAGFSITNCQGAPVNTPNGYCVGFLQLQHSINFAETIRNTMAYEFATMTGITASLSTLLNITPYFRPAGIIGISFSLSPAFRPLFDALGLMLSLLSVAVGEWFIQIWLLTFIKTRMLSIFVPIGLFLRALGLQRGGDALIAIAIGFFFVYPFMLNVSAMAVQSYLMSEFTGAGTLVGASDGSWYNSFDECIDHSTKMNALVPGSATACFFKLSTIGALNYVKSMTDSIGGIGPSLLIAGLVQLFTGALPAALGVSFMAFYLLALIKASLFYILVVSLIVPLFILFITLTLIKEIAQFLGTHMDFSAFEKLI